MLVQRREHFGWRGLFAQRQDNARAVLVAGFVRDVALEDQAGEFAVVEGLGDAGLDAGAADERDLGDDQALAALAPLPETAFKEGLTELAKFAVARKN